MTCVSATVYFKFRSGLGHRKKLTSLVRFRLFVVSASDGGATFSNSINLSNNTGYANIPRVSAFGDNEYVMWMQGKFNQGEIIFKFFQSFAVR